jgi:hypothetical protein
MRTTPCARTPDLGAIVAACNDAQLRTLLAHALLCRQYARPERPSPPRHAPSYPHQVCHACGRIEAAASARDWQRQGDASFCSACWRQLPADTVQWVVQVVALRGVPLS